MPGQKSPVLLRIMIVGVALFLGFSLNMFQFRNPFRSVATDYDQGKQALNPIKEEPAQKPIPPQVESVRQESPVPLPGAKPAGQAPEQAGQAKDSEAKPGAMAAADASKAGQMAPAADSMSPGAAGKPEPAQPAAPGKETAEAQKAVTPAAPAKPEAPEGKQEAAAMAPAVPQPPVPVVMAPEEAALEVPKVTSNKEVAKAAKIGRMTPVGSQPAAPDAKDKGAMLADAKGASETGQAMEAAPASVKKPVADKAAGQGKNAQDANGQGMEPKTAQAKPSAPASPADSGKAAMADAVPAAKPGEQDKSPSAATAAATASPSSPAEAVTPAPAEEKAPLQTGSKVLEIKAEEKSGEFVLTIVTDGPIGKVTTFHAKNPARLAVDLWGSWQTTGPMTRPVNGEMMERVRLGQHPDKMRLVIDYKDKDLKTLSEPIVEKQPKGVVVRLSKVTAGQ